MIPLCLLSFAGFSATKGKVNFPARSIMFSWSCSLSSCDLSHVELMGSCHNYTTLLDMKVGHCNPPSCLHTHLHTHHHNIQYFFFSRYWQDSSRLCAFVVLDTAQIKSVWLQHVSNWLLPLMASSSQIYTCRIRTKLFLCCIVLIGQTDNWSERYCCGSCRPDLCLKIEFSCLFEAVCVFRVL